MKANFNHKKILLVDDDLYIAKIIRSILEAFEVPTVTMVQTNDEALIMLDRYEYHCVFVDNMLQEKNGLKLAQYMRHSQNNKIQSVPIILCTAFTGIQSIIKARDSGITEILAKPVSPDQIMEKLNSALYSPRSFIVSDHYLGPDRRRRMRPIDQEAEKRQTQKDPETDSDQTTAKGEQQDAQE